MPNFDTSPADTPTSNGEEVDEIEVVDHEMEYSSILDIPKHVQIKSALHTYFAKIHSTAQVPTILGYIYVGFLVVQSMCPAFLIDNDEIWPPDNFLTTVMRIIGYLWLGPSTKTELSRVVMSLVLSIIFIGSIFVICARAMIFQKKLRILSGETYSIYLIYKFIIPIFCPHLLSGVPVAIGNIIYDYNVVLSVVTIVLALIGFVLFIYVFNSVIVPRVLLEDAPSHEWMPLLALASITNTSLQTFLAVMAGIIDGKAKVVLPIVMILICLFCGFYVFLSAGTEKRSASILFSTTAFTGAAIALVQAVNILMDGKLAPEIVLVIGIVFFVALYFLMFFINNKMVIEVMAFYDACIESPDNARELMKKELPTPRKFLSKVRLVLEQWHPYFISMNLFEYAISEWPENEKILLFYARILSFFPTKNNQMTWVASMISRLRTKRNYTSYLLQFRHLSRTRQTVMSPAIKRQIDDIHNQCDALNILLRRFWENVLQKNTSNFWDDVYKVNKRTNDVEATLQQMLDDYPNNESVLKEYISFVSKIKRDYIEEADLQRKLTLLKKEGRTKPDISLSVVTKIYPIFYNISQSFETQTISSETAIHEPEEKEEEASSESHIETAVQNLTLRSNLGRVWIGILILCLTTCLSVGLYVLFNETYVSGFITRETRAVEFLQNLNKAIYELYQMVFYVATFPMIIEGFPASIDQNSIMGIIAPTLYPDRVPLFNITMKTVTEKIGHVGDFLTLVINKLAQLDKKDEYVISMNYKLSQEKLNTSGITAKDTISQLTIDGKTVVMYDTPQELLNSKEFLRLELYFNELSQVISSISDDALDYASSSFESKSKDLNEKMVLVVMLTLLLVTLPYVLILFQLQIQSIAIADSFSFLPNTEIRTIINKFGTASSKTEDDATAIAQLSQLASNKSAELAKQVFTFALSFFPLLICCLVTYYCSSTFVSSSRSIASKIYTLYPAFGLLAAGNAYLIRLYQIDIDPGTYLPFFETREDIVNNTLTFLYGSMLKFSQGMWSEIAGANAYYSDKNKNIDYFTDKFPDTDEVIQLPMSYFEQFATEGLLRSIDIILGYATSLATKHAVPLKPLTSSDIPLIYSLLYWFGSFADENRSQIYFRMVENFVNKEIGHFSGDQTIVMIITILIQVVALFFIILYLIQRNIAIRGSLRFYHFIDPQVLLHNHNALLLIETGKRSVDKAKKSFSNAEYIVSKIGQGIVIVDRSLSIIDNNPAFLNILQRTDVKKCRLTDLILKDEEDNTWTEFISMLNESISGKFSPRFTRNITGRLSDGQTVHFTCSVIAMNGHSVAEEGDVTPIEKVAIVFEDCTQFFMRQQIIAQEQNLTKQILSQVMPERMVKSYMVQGCEGISFVVQSITIGQIEVRASKQWTPNTDEPFKFFSEIFGIFDEEMTEFDLLCKARTFGNTYCFVGGLFSEVNKPERHAEQAARFALKMISKADELSQKLGFDIEMMGGVHTGGPVVAGVMENQRPALQIIGPVMETAAQMTATGVRNQIQITRAVYELIFSAGFHIVERGDTEIRGGVTVTTYLVYPK